MQGTADHKGLIDGATNRYLRTNRSFLVPSFAWISQAGYGNNNDLGSQKLYKGSMSAETDKTRLHVRLEELLVFEIHKDGGTAYHRFTVRALHKYVIQAIKKSGMENVDGVIHPDTTGSNSGQNRRRYSSSSIGIMEKLSLGKAFVGGAAPLSLSLGTDNTKLSSIEEASTTKDTSNNSTGSNRDAGVAAATEQPVTYRERLGGFLHPRDMRRLATPFSTSNEPEIIVRRHAILLNFDPLRAIILRDRLLVVVPDGADGILVELEKRLRGGLETDESISGDTNLNPDIARVSSPPSNPVKIDDSKSNTDTDSTTGHPLESDENNNYNSVPMVGFGTFPDSATMTEDEQEFFEAFVENEWDELEGKAWIDLPFELQSLDAVLSCVSSMLAEDVVELQYAANAVIVDLLKARAHIDDSSQEVLRQMKNSVHEMTSRVDGFNRAMGEVLEDYEDMSLMNLSRLLTHPERFVQPVPQAVLEEESDEPELILESHLQRGQTLNNGLRLIQGQITSTEEYAERKSDAVRNQLLYINLVLQTLQFAVGVGSLVGAIFGMNVINSFEESHTAFLVITFTSLAFMGVISVFTMAMIHRLGNWKSV